MSKKMPQKGTLGPVSSKFIKNLQKRGKMLFDLNEASELYGKGHYETTKFLSDLVKREVLFRLKPGCYIILQKGMEKTQLSNWPIIARELAKPGDYFISHYSAMRYHGMTTHPLLQVVITMPKRRVTKKIGNINYHFIYSRPEHFWGYEDYWVTKQEKVAFSCIERTLLDGFSRPELCGGIKEVIRALWLKQNQINWNVLIEYASNYRVKAAVKRLGYVVEILELETVTDDILNKLCPTAKDYILLDPDGPASGPHITRWHIRRNLSLEELKEGVWG